MTDDTIWLDGVRVTLRDIGPADLDVLAYWLRPEQRWRELDGPTFDQPAPDEIARILEHRRTLATSRQRPRPRTNLGVADLDTDLILGEVSQIAGGDAPNLNIVIYNPDLWGYGLGYEALGLWCDYLFQDPDGSAALTLETWSGNAGMVRLAQKLGFAESTRDRRATVVGGRRHDALRYVLERAEWRRRFPDGFAATLEGEQ
jgi:putative hydrolase of HD superfamily